MSRGRLVASIAVALLLNACGSSGGGGTGGSGGQGGSTSTGGHGSGGATAQGGAGGGSGGGGGTSSGTGGGSAGAGGGATGTGGGAGAGGGTGGGTGGAGGSTGGAGGAGATCGDSTGQSSGDTCNTVAATGNCVQETLGNGNVPTANGGTVMAGTYDLMSKKIYSVLDGGVALSSELSTLVISSVTSTSFTLDMLDESGTQVQRSSGPVTISGTTLTFAPTCPAAGDGGNQGGTVGFTANGVTLTIFETSSQGTRVSVYNKR